MKNIVVIPSSGELDIVVSALSTIPQKIEKTKRGWFGGRATIRHERRVENGPIKFEANTPKADADGEFLSQHANVIHVYDYRPDGEVSLKPHAVAMLTYLERQYSAIDWGGVNELLGITGVARTGQRFRVKLPSGFWVIIEPLAHRKTKKVLSSKHDLRAKDKRKAKFYNNVIAGAGGQMTATLIEHKPEIVGSDTRTMETGYELDSELFKEPSNVGYAIDVAKAIADPDSTPAVSEPATEQE